jgi:hypothetical protein
LVASVLPTLENLSEDKHVESLLFPCLDEGSTPSSSTKTILNRRGYLKIKLRQPLLFNSKPQQKTKRLSGKNLIAFLILLKTISILLLNLPKDLAIIYSISTVINSSK